MSEGERLEKPETRELPMPNLKGPFSGRTYEGKYWGQDIQKVGKSGPEDVAIYGYDAAKEWFKTDFKLAHKYNHDRILAVTGREGFGKSTVAMWMALMSNPNLTVADIIFDKNELSKRLRTAEKGETIVVDEAGISMFAQEWWDKVQREVVKRLVAGRVKGLRVFFVSPHLGMLNNQIRNRRLDMWIYTIPVGRYGRGEAQMKEPQESKYKMSIYWEPRLTFKFPKLENDLWQDYAEKKTNFVDAVWEGETDEGNKNLEKLKLIYHMDYEKDEDYTSHDIAKHTTVGASRIRDLRAELKNNEKLMERVEEL